MLKIKPSVRLYLSKELEFFLPYIDRFSKRVNSMRNLHSLFVISLGNRVPGTNNKGYFIAFLVRSLKTRKAFAGPEGRPALLFYLTSFPFFDVRFSTVGSRGGCNSKKFPVIITTCIAAKGTPRITRILVKEMTN